jgi:indole-3-glycerol phosphate synthase
MTNVLSEIVEHKRGEIAAAKEHRPAESLEAAARNASPPRDFVAALRAARLPALIAEVKRRSPSSGEIRPGADAVDVATTYVRHGAACISVLTDARYFGGSLDDLRRVRAAVPVPVLRKDFIIDRYQVLEARAAGADCILLIAECLDDHALRDLHEYARSLGMHTLIEIYEPDDLDRVLALSPPLLGVNNRNLKIMQTDLAHSLKLRPRVPTGTLFVSESGIRTAADVARLRTAGVDAILVGESLMRSPDIGRAVDEMLTVE